MCGRYSLTAPAGQIAAAFDVPDLPDLAPRYNIAPSQLVAVVGLKADGRTRGIGRVRWGPRPINARAETVAFKFGASFRERRCLVPADGFYEWKADGKRKRARRFTLADGSVFAFAGLWDVWSGDGRKLVTACVVTTAANDLVRPVHDRMPVIVPKEHYAEWLDPETSEARLLALMRPYAAEAMKATAVGPAVNSPRNDGPECLEAA